MLARKRKPSETPPAAESEASRVSKLLFERARDRPAGRALFPPSSFYDRPNEASAPSFDLGIFTTRC